MNVPSRNGTMSLIQSSPALANTRCQSTFVDPSLGNAGAGAGSTWAIAPGDNATSRTASARSAYRRNAATDRDERHDFNPWQSSMAQQTSSVDRSVSVVATRQLRRMKPAIQGGNVVPRDSQAEARATRGG